MKRFVLSLSMLVIFSTATFFFAQDVGYSDMDKKIIAEERNHSELMKNLEYLCDMIGPRLTSSDGMKHANEWTAERFKEYGLENVHLENWSFGRCWTRGPATARLVSPNAGYRLIVEQMAWTAGTNGPVQGEVKFVNIRKVEDLEQYRGKLKNTFVLRGEPARIPAVPLPKQLRLPDTLAVEQARQQPDSAAIERFRQQAGLRDTINSFLRNEGVLAVIRDTEKPHALLNMTGGGGQNPNNPKPTPTTVFMIHEHYSLLYRLLQREEKVTIEMNLQSSYGDQIVDAYNTVAEIRGTEKPDEVVVVGAHLDSWDLGQGTTDNGTGSMTVLEAARILKAVGAQPKRTIRFILFSGEEEGLLGSRAYVEAHKDDLPKISGCLVLDSGSGRIRGIALQGNELVRPIFKEILAPFKEMGVIDINMRSERGTDHLSFDRVGVPGFAFIQDPLEYDKTHHSQSDTFDHALEDDLVQAAVVMASTVLKVANLPDLLPRKSQQAGASSSGSMRN